MSGPGSEAPDAAIVVLEGEIDLASVGAAEIALSDALAAAGHDLIVDLSAVTFMGVCAVPLLAVAERTLADRGGQLRIRGAASAVSRVIVLGGLARALDAPGVDEDTARTESS